MPGVRIGPETGHKFKLTHYQNLRDLTSAPTTWFALSIAIEAFEKL
jgi:hypothetical protein